jgi:hypothetical protein
MLFVNVSGAILAGTTDIIASQTSTPTRLSGKYILASPAELAPSQTTTPSPTPTCVPKKYFLDADGDGMIDTADAQWYGWYNSDSPTSTGDYEHIGYINGRYEYSFSSELYFCTYPIDVICVANDAAETPWDKLGLTITYDKNFGCWCVNEINNNACVDMKAKFLCPPESAQGYYGCNPPTGYISADSPLASYSASPMPSATPTPSATCEPKWYFLDADGDGFIDTATAQWYGWYSIDGPSGLGEYEHIDYVNGGPDSVLSDLSFCPYPIDIQCVEFNSETNWDQLGLNIYFDRHYGCFCLNSENNNACVNMKVKYLCPPQSEQAYFGCNPPTGYVSEDHPIASASPSMLVRPSPIVDFPSPSPSSIIIIDIPSVLPSTLIDVPSTSPSSGWCMKYVCENGSEPIHIAYEDTICLDSKYDAVANSSGYLECPRGGILSGKLCYIYKDATLIPCPSASPSSAIKSASPSSWTIENPCINYECKNGVVPTYTTLFNYPICIYSKYDAVANSAGYLECPNGGTLYDKTCYIYENAIAVPCPSANPSSYVVESVLPSPSSVIVIDIPSASPSSWLIEKPSSTSTTSQRIVLSPTQDILPSTAPQEPSTTSTATSKVAIEPSIAIAISKAPQDPDPSTTSTSTATSKGIIIVSPDILPSTNPSTTSTFSMKPSPSEAIIVIDKTASPSSWVIEKPSPSEAIIVIDKTASPSSWVIEKPSPSEAIIVIDKTASPSSWVIEKPSPSEAIAISVAPQDPSTTSTFSMKPSTTSTATGKGVEPSVAIAISVAPQDPSTTSTSTATSKNIVSPDILPSTDISTTSTFSMKPSSIPSASPSSAIVIDKTSSSTPSTIIKPSMTPIPSEIIIVENPSPRPSEASPLPGSASPSCQPLYYFYDGDRDGLIDMEGSTWQGWYNIDRPSGIGEYEHIGYLNGKPGSLSSELSWCPIPLNVECVSTSDELHWSSLGLPIHFNRHYGCWCINSESGDKCIDMKAKYLCPPATNPGYFGCNPPVGYIPITNGYASPSGTSKPSVSSSATASASASEIIKPSSSSSTVVVPSASVSEIVKPSSSSSTVVVPSASASEIVKPSSSSSIVVSASEIVKPSSSSSEVPTPSTITRETPSEVPTPSTITRETPSEVPSTSSSTITRESPSEVPTTSTSNLRASATEISVKPNTTIGEILLESGTDLSAINAQSDMSSPGAIAGFTLIPIVLLAFASMMAAVMYRKMKQNKFKKINTNTSSVRTQQQQPVDSNSTVVHNPLVYSNNPLIAQSNATVQARDLSKFMTADRQKVAFGQVRVNQIV